MTHPVEGVEKIVPRLCYFCGRAIDSTISVFAQLHFCKNSSKILKTLNTS